jgi:hypothetical protein
MSPAPPHRDINQTSMNTTRRQRLRAAPSLQARFAFPALTSVAQASPTDRPTFRRRTYVHGRHCVFWLACASLLIPNKAKRESSLRFRCPQCRRRCRRAFLVQTNGLARPKRLRRFFLFLRSCTPIGGIILHQRHYASWLVKFSGSADPTQQPTGVSPETSSNAQVIVNIGDPAWIRTRDLQLRRL